MKKILLSIAMIGFVGALAAGGTGAFFSDTETSSGNTFTAGAIDLTVDSTAHYNGMVCTDMGPNTSPRYQWQPEVANSPASYPVQGSECKGTWTLANLDGGVQHKFFELADLKPGDMGENTISLHATSNPALACAIIGNVTDKEVGACTEPEQSAEGTATCTDGAQGEIADQLEFFAWSDTDGDNVYGSGEQYLFSNVSGPASDVINGKAYLLTPPGQPLTPSATKYIGLQWCFGDMTVDTNAYTITCNGSGVDNKAQTDRLTANFGFYVEQERNNTTFACPDPAKFFQQP